MKALRALYRGENDFDFVGKFKFGFITSLVLLLASAGALSVQQLNLGIDFKGGVAYESKAPDVSVTETRDALSPLGLANAKIQTLGSDTLRVQTPPIEDGAPSEQEVRDVLSELTGQPAAEIGVTDVGPSWGNEISRKALRALVIFLIVIALYLTLRFEWRMALAAIVALVHDVLITVGVYAMFQFEVTPATVIAFLTILGFSLYDTIVVFDKLNENVSLVRSSGRGSFEDTLNLSMNEVMMRSVNTAITSLLPVVAMLVVGTNILGAVTLGEFAIALLVGMLTGVYSSIFVASPVVGMLKRRDPRFQARAGSGARPSAPVKSETDVRGVPIAPVPGASTIAARPRKKHRR